MIEIQIKNKELYLNLKRYANYFSDLTQVCSFRDEMASFLRDHKLEFDAEEVQIDKPVPTLTIQGKNIMELKNANAEMLHFVGVKSEYDPTIPLASMSRVERLIKANLVEVDEKFKTLYGKISYRNKINDLVCANVKFYGKGKLTEFIDGTLTIQSMGLNDVKLTNVVYKNLDLNVVDALIEGSKYSEIKCKIKNTNQNVTLRFYNKSNILKSIAYKGNKIRIATSKVYEENEGDFTISDPIVLPEGIEMPEEVAVHPIKRAIPADLFRNAYYEFMYRYNQ